MKSKIVPWLRLQPWMQTPWKLLQLQILATHSAVKENIVVIFSKEKFGGVGQFTHSPYKIVHERNTPSAQCRSWVQAYCEPGKLDPTMMEGTSQVSFPLSFPPF